MLRIEPGIMVGDLRSYFSLSAGGLGLLVSMYYWGYTPLQLVVGMVTDYFGARRVLITAIIACILGTFFFGYTHSYVLAGVARFFVGIGSAFAFVGALKLGADWLPRRHFSVFVGFCTTLGMVGAMFGETAMSWVVDHIGWHPVIQASVWLGIVLAGVFLLFVYEKHEVVQYEHRVTPISYRGLCRVLLKLLSNKTILQVGFIGCAAYLSLSLLAEQWANVYIQKAMKVNAQDASYFVDMIFLGWAVGSPLSGLLSEKIRSRKWVLFWGCFFSLLCVIPVIMVPEHLSRTVLLLLLFGYGFFSGAEINCFAIIRDLVETRLAATASGLINTMVMLSGMLVQPMFAYSLNWLSVGKLTGSSGHVYRLQDYQTALIIVPVFLLIALYMAWKMSDSYEVGDTFVKNKRISLSE